METNYNVAPFADLHTMPGRWLARLAVMSGKREVLAWDKRLTSNFLEDRAYWAGLSASVELAIGDRLLMAANA